VKRPRLTQEEKDRRRRLRHKLYLREKRKDPEYKAKEKAISKQRGRRGQPRYRLDHPPETDLEKIDIALLDPMLRRRSLPSLAADVEVLYDLPDEVRT
jgi:hypothetical protein